MLKQTRQQRANTLEALNVMWPSVPEENVIHNLKWWRDVYGSVQEKVDGNTVACFGGWCAVWPPFQEQGVIVGSAGNPMIDGDRDAFVDWHLFGDSRLFSVRGGHAADLYFQGTDHALVTNRLKWLLANSEVWEDVE